MKEFCALRAKSYSYLMDDNSGVRKSKETKKMGNKTSLCWKTTQQTFVGLEDICNTSSV